MRGLGYIGLFFFLITAGLQAEEENTILVAKIKIEIGENRYIWKDLLPQRVQDSEISPSAVVSFTSIYPGMELTVPALENEVNKTTARLENSHLFYSSSVFIVPPRTSPGTRTVVIKVVPGFAGRFGGGNAYAYVGTAALNGERIEAGFTAGVNKAGLKLENHNVFGERYYLGASLFYGNDLFKESELAFNSFDQMLAVGKYLTPDLLMALETTEALEFYSAGEKKGAFTLTPFLRYTEPKTDVLEAEFTLGLPLQF